MKPILNKFHVQGTQFAGTSSFCSGILYIDKVELAEYFMEDTDTRSMDFDIAGPGESVRIIPIKDAVQPRFKWSGLGQVFPGFVGDVGTVGNGEMNVLEDCAVVTPGKIVAFQEGIIDISGPRTEFSSFSEMNILVPLIYPAEGLGKHIHEATVRIAGLKTATYMTKTILGLEPDEKGIFEHESILEVGQEYSYPPKVVYMDIVQCQGLMRDTYVYGLNVKGILPIMIGPLEVLDGTVISGNCAAPGHKNAVIHYEGSPIILDLLRRHGKELCFVGVLLSNESAMLKEKKQAVYYTSSLSQLLSVDGAIVSEKSGDNPEADLMFNCRLHENKGVKTVLVTDEYCGCDGASQGLADVTPEADTVVTDGNSNQFVAPPKMERVIGDIETVRIITGGDVDNIGKDGAVPVEVTAIIGPYREMGYEHMITRLRQRRNHMKGIIHYLNQFYGQIGGEEFADQESVLREGTVGSGTGLQVVLGKKARIVAAIIYGDNCSADHQEDTLEAILTMTEGLAPNMSIADPESSVGRCGLTYTTICVEVKKRLFIPTLTVLYPGNPGAEMFCSKIYIVETSIFAAGMRQALPVMGTLTEKLPESGEIGLPEEGGYTAQGFCVNVHTKKNGAERAVDMTIKKLRGEPYVTELPIPVFDRVKPAPAVKDMAHTGIALIIFGGIVPQGSPDHIPSANTGMYGIRGIENLDRLTGEGFMTVHGGYDLVHTAEDPDCALPLDVCREVERDGGIGEPYGRYYSMVGNTTAVNSTKRFVEEIAQDMIRNEVQTTILTSN